MKKTKRSRAKKPAVIIPTAHLPYASQQDISRGYQHIQDIAIACRQVENQLRQQGQNPLDDTLKYLNLAEPRLTDKIIDSVIRPYFYFGFKHDQIPNQKPFQDAVREKLSNPDALFIFDKMIRIYFQAFDFRIDGRNGKKTIRRAFNTPHPPTPFAVHNVFPWSPARKPAIYVGQLISWNDCKFFVAYGRLNPKMIAPFKRSISIYQSLEYREFLDVIEPQLFARFADPLDKHRRDHYIQKHTPKPHTVLKQLASHILPNDPAPLQNLAIYAAQQTTIDQIHAFNQKVERAYTEIVLGKYAYFPSIARKLPLQELLKILFSTTTLATQHLQTIEQHPLKNLLLDNTIVHEKSLPATIQQARSSQLPKNIVEDAWKAYATEQRLAKILHEFYCISLLDHTPIIHLIFQAADSRFQDIKIADLVLEERARKQFSRYVESYIIYNYIDATFEQLTLSDLLNTSIHQDPFDFDDLSKPTKQDFVVTLNWHLANWRRTAQATPTSPTLTSPSRTSSSHVAPITPAAKTALDALNEINDLFDTH